MKTALPQNVQEAYLHSDTLGATKTEARFAGVDYEDGEY